MGEERAEIDTAALLRVARVRVAESATLEDLKALELELLGKRSEIALANRRLGGLDEDARRAEGRRLGEIRSELESLVSQRRAELENVERTARLEADRLDLTELPDRLGC